MSAKDGGGKDASRTRQIESSDVGGPDRMNEKESNVKEEEEVTRRKFRRAPFATTSRVVRALVDFVSFRIVPGDAGAFVQNIARKRLGTDLTSGVLPLLCKS